MSRVLVQSPHESHVVITGASGGIGAALARTFASMGANVTVVDRHREPLVRLTDDLKVRSHVVQVDLLQDPIGWLNAAEEELGPIDVLINNAGDMIAGPFADTDPRRERDVLALDLAVPLSLMRAVLPGMLERQAGTIVNITSTGALAPNPGMVAYCAAKAGLAAASESLRGELRGSGVHVVTVYPGPTETEMLKRAYAAYPPAAIVRMLPRGSPAALAERIADAVRRGRPRVIYPTPYTLFRYFPPLVCWFLDRFSPVPLKASEQGRPIGGEPR